MDNRPEFKKFLQEYTAISDEYSQKKAYQKVYRANRSKWIGGGFGIKDLLIKVKWKFQNIEFEKKGIRNQAAEQFKIERAAGQGGVWYRFRPVSVCLDNQLQRRNKFEVTC